MEWYIIIGVILIGFVVGFINTMAGSGSLISLPFLIFLGLDPNVANGTNRIGILMQSITATGSFKKQKIFDWKEGLLLAIPAVAGSIVGAMSAVRLSGDQLKTVIAILLIFMFFLMIYKPDIWVKGRSGKTKKTPWPLQTFIFFFIGLYGGFIQAGVGFFLLAGLVLGAGFDLVKANAIKVLIILLYTPFALAVFMYNNQVNYWLGFVLGIGNMLGAYTAARLSINKGAKFIRYFLLFMILVAAIKLLLF